MYYAVIPSSGCYGSGDTVCSVYGTRDRKRAIRTAERMTREHQKNMAPYGGTSGGYRAVSTEDWCPAGTAVASYGWAADQYETIS